MLWPCDARTPGTTAPEWATRRKGRPPLTSDRQRTSPRRRERHRGPRGRRAGTRTARQSAGVDEPAGHRCPPGRDRANVAAVACRRGPACCVVPGGRALVRRGPAGAQRDRLRTRRPARRRVRWCARTTGCATRQTAMDSIAIPRAQPVCEMKRVFSRLAHLSANRQQTRPTRRQSGRAHVRRSHFPDCFPLR